MSVPSVLKDRRGRQDLPVFPVFRVSRDQEARRAALVRPGRKVRRGSKVRWDRKVHPAPKDPREFRERKDPPVRREQQDHAGAPGLRAVKVPRD